MVLRTEYGVPSTERDGSTGTTTGGSRVPGSALEAARLTRLEQGSVEAGSSLAMAGRGSLSGHGLSGRSYLPRCLPQGIIHVMRVNAITRSEYGLHEFPQSGLHATFTLLLKHARSRLASQDGIAGRRPPSSYTSRFSSTDALLPPSSTTYHAPSTLFAFCASFLHHRETVAVAACFGHSRKGPRQLSVNASPPRRSARPQPPIQATAQSPIVASPRYGQSNLLCPRTRRRASCDFRRSRSRSRRPSWKTSRTLIRLRPNTCPLPRHRWRRATCSAPTFHATAGFILQ